MVFSAKVQEAQAMYVTITNTTASLFTALYHNDKGEFTALYKINPNAYIKPKK